MKLDCTLTHDGANWLASGEHIDLAAPSLGELDDNLRGDLRRRGLIGPGETAEIFMAFDDATIPAWIRPFAQHYFNRIVRIEGDAT